MVILLPLPMIPKHPNFLSQPCVICRDSSSLTTSSQIFCGIEAKGIGFSYGSGLSPRTFIGGEVFRSVRLTGIFDDHQPILFSDIHDRIHVGDLPIDVHWHDGRNASAACAMYGQTGSLTSVTIELKIVSQA